MTTATSAAPSTVIDLNPATPPRSSLLTAATVVNTRFGGDGSWVRGVAWTPENCGVGDVGMICPSVPYAKEGAANSDPVTADPFVIWTGDKCSAFGYRDRDFYGRARRQLLASESYYIEREFMLNTLGISTNSAVINNGDITVTTVTAAAVDPTTALSQIEDEIGNCSRGARMMIHVRPGIATLLAASGAIRREGNVWLTATDNIVVPGRGYPATSPTGAAVTAEAEWIYATSMVTIFRDEIVFVPEQAPITPDNPYGIPAAAVERTTNDIMILAERLVAVAWDPSCCVLAAQTTRVHV